MQLHVHESVLFLVIISSSFFLMHLYYSAVYEYSCLSDIIQLPDSQPLINYMQDKPKSTNLDGLAQGIVS